MISPRLRTLLPVLVATAGLTASSLAAPTYADHAKPPGPVHAGNTFGWYSAGRPIDYTFVGPKAKYWKVAGPGIVRNQHGMLTLNTAKRGTVSATLDRKGHRTGRWEIRLRARRYELKHTNYRVVTELIPAVGRPYHCGGRNIALENFKFGSGWNDFYIRNDGLKFTANKRGVWAKERWHTFAVEVTRKRISWFVDSHVIRTERRAKALSGVPMTVRFTMQGVKGKRMNRSRMQMDWLRYWNLKSPNKKSTKAPRPEKGTFADAC